MIQCYCRQLGLSRTSPQRSSSMWTAAAFMSHLQWNILRLRRAAKTSKHFNYSPESRSLNSFSRWQFPSSPAFTENLVFIPVCDCICFSFILTHPLINQIRQIQIWVVKPITLSVSQKKIIMIIIYIYTRIQIKSIHCWVSPVSMFLRQVTD